MSLSMPQLMEVTSLFDRFNIDPGDLGPAEHTAHSLKGCAATLGINVLVERAAEAETVIKQGQEADGSVQTLSKALKLTVSAMQAAIG